MQQYIGTKLIAAEPMTRLAYNVFRGWALPADENGDDEGYLVEYLDGGKPNVPTHAGYVSWSPKAQLEAAYKAISGVPAGYATMPPHQQRVVIEKAELDSKRSALINFIMTTFFNTLANDEKGRLEAQLAHMNNYSEILGERIAAF